MKSEYIDKLYSSACNGDIAARNRIISLAGNDPATDADVFVALSILKGADTRAVIRKYAKLGNPEAVCSYGNLLVEDATSTSKLIKGLCWLEEAGNKGCARAFSLLSSWHECGDCGVPRDWTLAMQYGVKCYYAGGRGIAHWLARMLYDHLEISDVMLGDAVDWCKICIGLKSDCDATWQLADIQRRYGADRIESATRIIPKDFAGRKFEHYIEQYGHPGFGIFD